MVSCITHLNMFVQERISVDSGASYRTTPRIFMTHAVILNQFTMDLLVSIMGLGLGEYTGLL